MHINNILQAVLLKFKTGISLTSLRLNVTLFKSNQEKHE